MVIEFFYYFNANILDDENLLNQLAVFERILLKKKKCKLNLFAAWTVQVLILVF